MLLVNLLILKMKNIHIKFRLLLYDNYMMTYITTLIHSIFLSVSSAGGVILSCLGGRIQCNNTLESRLELSTEKVKS